MQSDATWCGGIGLSPGDFVLDGAWGPSFSSPGAQSHNFRPMSVVAKRLDGLRRQLVWRSASAQATCVQWGPSYSQNRGYSHHPVFGPCLLWPNDCMDEDATWYGSRPRPRPHCIRRGASYARITGTTTPRLFGPCLLWPRLPISATARGACATGAAGAAAPLPLLYGGARGHRNALYYNTSHIIHQKSTSIEDSASISHNTSGQAV